MEFSDAPARTPAQPRISLRDHADYVSLTMEFRCNLACVHCMIEGTMDRLTPQPESEFQAEAEQVVYAAFGYDGFETYLSETDG